MKKESFKRIQKRKRIHCARGPRGCKICAEYAKEDVYCLLELFPEPGMMARPMAEVEIEGEKMMCEFDIVKYFDTEKEARDYGEKNNIPVDI